MDIVLLLLQQNAIMLCYLIVGYVMLKKKILSVNGSADIGKMLLYFIMPVSIIKSYIRTFSPDMLR